MAHRIEVGTGQNDDALQRFIREETGIDAGAVRTFKVYTIDANLDRQALDHLGSELFADPVTETFSVEPIANAHNWDFAIEVQYKPGITDNPGKTATRAVREITGQTYPVYTSRQFLLNGVSQAEAEKIAYRLANGIVQNVKIKSREEWDKREGMGVFVPTPRFEADDHMSYNVDFSVSDEELLAFSDQKCLALTVDQMRAIEKRYTRPTDEEIEVIAQRWSEHCNHNMFNADIQYEENGRTQHMRSLFKTYIRGATEALRDRGLDWLVSVFTDNAGIIKFDEEFNLAFKAETHNAPSKIDPYMGALTGVNGLARDIFGAALGAKELARLDVLCFGDPSGTGIPSYLPHPRRMFGGVRSGVRDGGNKCGIPTVNGSVVFDSYPFGSVMRNLRDRHERILPTVESYAGRPLVYCGSAGIIPAYINGKPSHEKKSNPGDTIILIGGRTGKDGVHGATMSSRIHDEHTPVTAVQMDEAIVQRCMFDFQLDARDKLLYNDVGDNGAGGISCSVSEMAHGSGGAEVELEKVPLKYTGMIPREILISESQDRMTLAVAPDKVDDALGLAERYGVEATVIGRFTDSGYFKVNFNGRQLANLELDFLKNGSPRLKLNAKWEKPSYAEPEFAQPDIREALHGLLGRPNIASKETTLRMYDHEVKGQTVGKPFTGANNDGPADAAVVWPLEMQNKDSRKGFSVSHGINSRYGFIDTYHMAAANIDEAIRNAVAVGADPKRIALLDNFCWSTPSDPYRLAQLVRACQACYDYSVDFGTPFVSGKDSMNNDFTDERLRISVPPTLLISALGLVHDVGQRVSMDAKQHGNYIYVVGTTADEMGGSEYYAMMGARQGEAWIGNRVPRVNARHATRKNAALHEAARNEFVVSYHDCSDGGLGVALAEMAFAGGYGIATDIRYAVPSFVRDDHALFSETNSRMIAEVPVRYAKEFENVMRHVSYAQIGTVTESPYLRINRDGRELAHAHIDSLKKAWQEPLRW